MQQQGQMGNLRCKSFSLGLPAALQTARTCSFDLFCNIVSLLWGQNHHNISSLHAHANRMFDFIRMQLVSFLYWRYMDHLFMFGDFLDTTEIYCFSVSIFLHSICLYPYLSHLVEEEAFLLLLRLANFHLCGFFVLISRILFHFTFACHSFPSFLHSPPHICSWCFLPTAPDPLNSAGSSPTLLYGVFMWAESAFLQLIGQSETLLFQSLSYSALI